MSYIPTRHTNVLYQRSAFRSRGKQDPHIHVLLREQDRVSCDKHVLWQVLQVRRPLYIASSCYDTKNCGDKDLPWQVLRSSQLLLQIPILFRVYRLLAFLR